MDITTLTEISNSFPGFENLAPWQLVAAILLGVLLVFLGYRVKKVAFFLIWFVLGQTLMSYLMPLLNNAFADLAANDLWQWLLPLAGGLLLALLGFSIEKVCVSGICFGLVMAATVEYFGAEMQTLVTGAVVGVIAAGAAVMLMKPATIVATAAAGAYLVTLGLLTLLPEIDSTVWYWPLMLGVTAVGSVTQFLTSRSLK